MHSIFQNVRVPKGYEASGDSEAGCSCVGVLHYDRVAYKMVLHRVYTNLDGIDLNGWMVYSNKLPSITYYIGVVYTSIPQN